MRHSPYLEKVMTDPGTLVLKARETLCPIVNTFDAIVCTGVSGMLLAPTLAWVLDKRLAVIRKGDDKQNHATTEVESSLDYNDRWIFVDDMIASGATIQRVERRMLRLEGFEGEMVGYYMYNGGEFTKGGWI